jgi:hypothetical protein
MNLLMPKYRVRNFGLSGAGTVQQYLLFQAHVTERLRPGDIVVIAFYQNDLGDNIGRFLEGRAHAAVEGGRLRLVPPDDRFEKRKLKNRLKDCSYLFNLVAYNVDRWRSHRRMRRATGRATPQEPQGEQPTLLADNSPEVRVAKAFLRAFKRDCGEKKARLALAYVPGQTELREDNSGPLENVPPSEQAAYREAFFRCANSLGIETIDLLPHLLNAKKPGKISRLTFPRDFHWNEHAHRVAAEAIANSLLAADVSLVQRETAVRR